MASLLVPHEVSATEATVWVGAIDEPFGPAQVDLASIPRCRFTFSKEGSHYGYASER
jgi:hypothetical protein